MTIFPEDIQAGAAPEGHHFRQVNLGSKIL
jgi:hypothetical protein